MNASAYDITHLLELEAAAPAMLAFRPAKPAAVKAAILGVAAAQEALAGELLKLADRHEALIQQYLRLKDDLLLGTDV
jgi:hypothetical protein